MKRTFRLNTDEACTEGGLFDEVVVHDLALHVEHLGSNYYDFHLGDLHLNLRVCRNGKVEATVYDLPDGVTLPTRFMVGKKYDEPSTENRSSQGLSDGTEAYLKACVDEASRGELCDG